MLRVLILSLISVYLLSAAGPAQPIPLPSIQRLEVQPSPNGPVIRGLFGLFQAGPLGLPNCVVSHCQPGSNMPGVRRI